MEHLTDKKEERLPTYMSGLAELALSAQAMFEEKSKEVLSFVKQEVLFKKSPSEGVCLFMSYCPFPRSTNKKWILWELN